MITGVNQTGAQFLLTGGGALQHQRFDELVAEESQEIFREHWHDVFSGAGPRSCEITLNRQDGVPLRSELHSRLLRGSEEGASELIITVADIMRQVEIEAALVLCEERCRDIFEHSRNGITIHRPIDEGTDFVLEDINPAAAAIGEYHREAIVGKRLAEAFPALEEPGLLEVVKEVYRTGELRYYPVI